MPILRAKDIAKMPANEKRAKLLELRKELIKLQSQRATGSQITSPGKIRAIKRTIAKILTLSKMKMEAK
ncbi:MAG: 50S ribosomal protein L29 [archaeon]